MIPGYLIWQAEHQNDYMKTSAEARAQRAAELGLLIHRRRGRLAGTMASVWRATSSAWVLMASPLHGRVGPLAPDGAEVPCP